jgi:hypothetical protein
VTALADYARPVEVIRADDASGAEARVSALLAHEETAGWAILLPESERFWERTRVHIRGLGAELPVELGALRDMGEGYCLFALAARIGDGTPPRYPPPQRRQTLPDSDNRDPIKL